MSRRLTTPSIVAISALAVSLLAGPQVVKADGVDDAKRKLAQILDNLENLRNQMAQIDEDYNGALDRQDELVVEIEASQARVDEMTATLGEVQVDVQQIAINKYTSGDSMAFSPLFSNAATYSMAGQRSALSSLAINSGEGNVDDLEAIVTDLAADRETLAKKQDEAAQLIASLESKKTEMASLEKTYLASYSKAEKELGKAKFHAAEAAREAEAQRRQQQEFVTQQQAAKAAPKGGAALLRPGAAGLGQCRYRCGCRVQRKSVFPTSPFTPHRQRASTALASRCLYGGVPASRSRTRAVGRRPSMPSVSSRGHATRRPRLLPAPADAPRGDLCWQRHGDFGASTWQVRPIGQDQLEERHEYRPPRLTCRQPSR